jgi:hypothetical protein
MRSYCTPNLIFMLRRQAGGVAVPPLVTETRNVPNLQGLSAVPVSGKPAAFPSDWKECSVRPSLKEGPSHPSIFRAMSLIPRLPDFSWVKDLFWFFGAWGKAQKWQDGR